MKSTFSLSHTQCYLLNGCTWIHLSKANNHLQGNQCNAKLSNLKYITTLLVRPRWARLACQTVVGMNNNDDDDDDDDDDEEEEEEDDDNK